MIIARAEPSTIQHNNKRNEDWRVESRDIYLFRPNARQRPYYDPKVKNMLSIILEVIPLAEVVLAIG